MICLNYPVTTKSKILVHKFLFVFPNVMKIGAYERYSLSPHYIKFQPKILKSLVTSSCPKSIYNEKTQSSSLRVKNLPLLWISITYIVLGLYITIQTSTTSQSKSIQFCGPLETPIECTVHNENRWSQTILATIYTIYMFIVTIQEMYEL